MQDRWQQIERIFHEASERPESDRVAFLAAECGDDETLRAEVESLLARDKTGTGLIDRTLTLESIAAIAPGSRLGPYQLEALIGKGGMGQVFRARDQRLNRTVAIKVCDARFGERFQREARAISSLNHPHICTLHDVGLNYIVMELVEGETLASLIKRAPLPLEATLRYGVQMTNALIEAHLHGIIHRDLKPSNVMVSRHGIKVLDFSLAKIASETGVDLTRTNTVMGTPAYMSPEQLEGRPADARSDLFSLGLILYEMATGRLPVPGASLASVLISGNVTVPLPSKLRPGIPPSLDELLTKLLSKDPADRPQTATEVREALAKIAARPAGVAVSRLAIAAGLLLMLAGGWWGYRHLVNAAFVGPAMGARPLTAFPGNELDASFSPDGSQIIFAWSGEKDDNFDIYTLPLGSRTPRRITENPADERWPEWSPDGKQIAFLRRSTAPSWEVVVVPAGGGAERRLATVSLLGEDTLYDTLAWRPDSKALILVNRDESGQGMLSELSIVDGDLRTLVSARRGQSIGQSGLTSPVMSPSGKWLAFVDAGRPVVQPLDAAFRPNGLSISPPVDSIQGVHLGWLPGDHLVFSQGEDFVDSQLSEWDLAKEIYPFWAGNPLRRGISIRASSGMVQIVTAQGDLDHYLWLQSLDPSQHAFAGPGRAWLNSNRAQNLPEFSPDGTVAFITNRTGKVELWVADRDGGGEHELYMQGGKSQWFRDGKRLVFERWPDGEIILLDTISGIGKSISGDRKGQSPAWSADGNYVYINALNDPGQIIRIRIADGIEESLTRGLRPRETTDGKRLVFIRAMDGLYARSTSGDIAKNPEALVVKDLVDPNANLAIARNGLYYVVDAPNGKARAFRYFDFGTSQSKDVGPAPDYVRWIAVSPDEKSLIYSRWRGSTDLVMLEFAVSK